MSNHRPWLHRYGVWLLLPVAILVAFYPRPAKAADSGFNIQVSPSPLAVTLTPGQRQTATLTIRNLSNHSETLTPRLNGFTTDNKTGKIELSANVPLGLDQWISFGQSSLTLPAGATQPLTIIYNTPDNAGFSYHLAITLSPAEKQPQEQGATIQASVAVFNLININRPDAKRELTIESFKSDKSHYQFLPANFELTVKNSGNVIDQPAGNLFIQRSYDDPEPIAIIPINKTESYILPDTSRKLTSTWDKGFPRYETVAAEGGGQTKTHLKWDWRNANQLRIGKYVAKVVLVYNDGQRDVPLTASYTFWVIPWWLILGVLFFGALVVTGLIAWGRMIFKGTSKVKRYAARHR